MKIPYIVNKKEHPLGILGEDGVKLMLFFEVFDDEEEISKHDEIEYEILLNLRKTTGIDLVKEQIRIADGKSLSYKQEDVSFTGHSIECRINAENPLKNFRPSPGKITGLYMPGGKGIRVDTAAYSGYEVSPYYDSMLAKLIVHAKNRKEALKKMKSALGEVIIEGIDTNVDYLYDLVMRLESEM